MKNQEKFDEIREIHKNEIEIQTIVKKQAAPWAEGIRRPCSKSRLPFGYPQKKIGLS